MESGSSRAASTGRRASLAAVVGLALGAASAARAGDPLVKLLDLDASGALVLGGRDGAKAAVDVYGIVPGPAAAARVRELVGKELVAVRPAGRRADGRNVGVVYLADGRCLAEVLLSEGLAAWDREQAPDAPGYEALEEGARSAGRGAAPPPPRDAPPKVPGRVEGLEALEATMDATSAEERAAAARALGGLGKEAIPALLGGLRDGSDLAWRHSAAALARIGGEAVGPLVAALQDREGVEHDRVLRALALMGPAASAAIPTLTAILALDAGPMRSDAMHALGAAGDAAEEAVPALARILGDDAPHERLQAARAIGRIGVGGDDVAAQLHSCVISDRSAAVREEAAAALARSGEPETVDWLVAALASPRAEMAAISLGKMGERAVKAVPALGEAAKEQKLRLNVSAALGSIGSPGAVALLAEMLDDPMIGVRSNAEISLGKIGLDAVPLHVVGRLLRSREPRVRIAAAQALNGRGADAADEVDALVAGLADTTRGVRENCLQALAKVGPAGAKALSAVVPLLSDRSHDTRILACWVVGAMGEASRPHVMTLAGMLASEPLGEVRRHVCNALGNLGPVAKEAIPALGDAAEGDSEAEVRRAAAAAVAKVRARR